MLCVNYVVRMCRREQALSAVAASHSRPVEPATSLAADV